MMKEFFKSVKFKIIIILFVLLLGILLSAVSKNGLSKVIDEVVSFVATPFQQISSSISSTVDNVFGKYINIDKTIEENDQLKSEIAKLRDKLTGYEDSKIENEQLKKMLEFKEQNQDWELTPSMVIANDGQNRYTSFVIDKGGLDGIELHDPVVTMNKELVGVVTNVNYTSATVTTILDSSINVGAYEIRTRDTGIITGDVKLGLDGLCKMSFLPRESGISIGDSIVTTNTSNIYPKNLLVGLVTDIEENANGSSLNATVKPYASIQDLSEVFVITSFYGQLSEIEKEVVEDKE